MNAARSRYQCPTCDAEFDAPSKYCRQCGANMNEDMATDDTLHTGESKAESEPAFNRRVSDRDRDLWLGRTIDDRYRVIEVIGRGGMGMVYKVEHLRMGKIAAMKVLHQEYTDDQEVVERFHLEAEAVSRLAHPNTVQVFDFGQSRGSLFLIMEYVRGQNMSALLHRDGPIPFTRSGPMFMQICAALTEAHAKGVIHRDLKPENVLATRTHRGRDFIKVLDFGLAKLSERDEAASVTDKGLIVGTPYYMSPEQIRGENVDERTDVYSLGSLMYRMLTGKHAFTAKTPMGVLTKHLTADLIPPAQRAPDVQLSAAVDDIVVRAMAKDREDRFESAVAMLDALEHAYIEASGHSSSLGVPGLSSLLADATSPSRVVRELALDYSDEIDYGMVSSERLQRSDLDQFERSLSRRRWLGLSIVPLVIAAVAAAVVYFLVFRDEGPRTSESEPNNEIDAATLIAPHTEVTGHLGKRIDKTHSDRDFYSVDTAAGSAVVTAHVTGLPNMDIKLSIVDSHGAVLAHIDAGRIGQDEWLRRYRVRSPFYVLVTESQADGALMPTENVSDSYTLSVDIDPPSRDREIEPNDSSSDAHGLRAGRPVMGYLDRLADVDTYRFEGTAGRYELLLDGASQIPIQWQTDHHAPSSERKALVELTPGQAVRISRTDGGQPSDQPVVGISSPYTLTLAPSSPP